MSLIQNKESAQFSFSSSKKKILVARKKKLHQAKPV